MASPTYCVYNQTRECFLSLGRVTPADTTFMRFKGLIGRLNMRSDEGLWVPSSGVHTWVVSFPLDLIYLDEKYRVVFVREHGPRFCVGPLRLQAASVLALPTHTIYSSQTQAGDQLVICTADEIEKRLTQGVSSVSSEKGGGRR